MAKVSQNVDNFLGSRPSTRVHAPPGGASSICFGGYDAPAAAPKPSRRAPLREVTASAAPVVAAAAPKPTVAATAASHTAAAATTAAAPAAAATRVSSNRYADGANQNCGNFITDRPTTRLHAPPGGKSSFSLGWN